MSRARLRAALLSAIAVGAFARLVQAALKPFWADEIFTLVLARLPVPAILEALRADSGGPLHYLVARALLLPFGTPGPHDGLIRALSVMASLLHVPLFGLVARRLSVPGAGLRAAAIYALAPLSVYFGAEGRAYVVASLFAFLAFERALAVRETPTPGRVAGLALAAGTAVQMHFLAVFPVAGLLVLLAGASPRARAGLATGGVGGALLFLPFVPALLHQPLAALAWARFVPFELRLLRLPVTLLGLTEPERPAGIAVLLAIGVLAVLVVSGFRSRMAPVAGVFVLGLALFFAASLGVPAILRPGRSVFFFLPFVALLAAGAPRPVPLLSVLVPAAFLPLVLWSAHFPSAIESLTELLLPEAARGARVVVAGLPALEVDYRLARAGLPGRVVSFPSDVSRHPGWYEEDEVPESRLEDEAIRVVSATPRPSLWVLPKSLRASAALRAALAPLGPRRLADHPVAELLAVAREPREGARLAVPGDP